MRRTLFLIPLIVLFVQACIANPPTDETGGGPLVTQGSPIASVPTSAQDADIGLTDTPKPTMATARPTLTRCMKVGGRVELEHITTDLLPEPLAYRIYLPPCYDEEAARHYPVLYLIHGKDSTDSQWDNLGVPETLDRLVVNGEVPPFLVVMPRDRVWYEPTVDNFGQAVVQTLLPWVDEHYRTLPERQYRAIGGLSRGGAWALHIGFSHPELFSAVGMHSSIVFDTDMVSVYQWLTSFTEEITPRIYMDIGDQDQPEITTLATWVESLLTKYGIRHEWHLYEGGHDAEYWGTHVEEYLRWYSLNWRDEPNMNEQ